MSSKAMAGTVRALHAVAELVLAGPQYRMSGTIRLHVSPGGFRTVREPDLRVEGAEVAGLDSRTSLVDTTAAAIGTALGVAVGAPQDVYLDGSGSTVDDPIRVDPASAALVADALQMGDTALRRLGSPAEPTLWPEHFDLGIIVDGAGYGVCVGDSYLAEPYAYVSVASSETVEFPEFFTAPFGAARPVRLLGDTEAVTDFFLQGRRNLSLRSTGPAAP